MARTTAREATDETGTGQRTGPDYDAPDVLYVRRPDQLKALGDELRARIVVMLRERAQSVSELAEKLTMAKGTVGHHVKVLESAGLVQVVRTRRVRAVTEKYYGRTARLFLYETSDGSREDVRNIVAASLRLAAEEILPVDEEDAAACSGVLRVRLSDAAARRFDRRLAKLMNDFRDCDDPEGRPYGLALALYRRASDA